MKPFRSYIAHGRRGVSKGGENSFKLSTQLRGAKSAVVRNAKMLRKGRQTFRIVRPLLVVCWFVHETRSVFVDRLIGA